MNKKYLYAISAVALAGAVIAFSKYERAHSPGQSLASASVSPGEQRSAVVPSAIAPSVQADASHRASKEKNASRSPAAAKLPSGNLATNLSQLESQAYSGHPEIAYALARDLFACSGNLQNGNDRFPTDPSTSFAEKCHGLTDKDYQEAINLLTYSAQMGDVNAQNAYMGDIGSWIDKHPELQYKSNFASTFAQNSLNFLQNAASSGNVDAMVSLANAYDTGVITDRDPVSAYAYMYSASKTGLIPASQRVLTLWQSRLSASEVSSAITRGQAIYLNCCAK